MVYNVKLDLPADVVERLRGEGLNLDADVTEAYTLELFRRGKLSHFELSRILALDRFETDAWLKRRGVYEGSLTMADLDADRRTLDRIVGKNG